MFTDPEHAASLFFLYYFYFCSFVTYEVVFQMLEEEYVQEAADKEWMQQYEKPNRELDNRYAIVIRYLPFNNGT
jgi:hypothetical protein